MGVIFSRFRKKKTTIQKLEEIDQEVTRLEKFKRQNQERQKWFIAKLLLYSILSYIAAALVFYFYYFPDKWKDRLLYSIPLLLFPAVIWLVKKVLHWYFIKRIAKNDIALEELRERKKQILEDVMEKETYKKAKEILERFDPVRFKELEMPKVTPPQVGVTPGTELRQRHVPQQRSPPGSQLRPMTPGHPAMTPMRPQQGGQLRPGMTPFGPRSGSIQGMQPRNLLNTPQQPTNGSLQGPPLPRPILPRERSTMDRMLEYLVGDGPQNRYALICQNCFSHNGMAMKEEFEYITFRCCYCYTPNPARKKRPFAPRIEPIAKTSTQDEESKSEEEDEEEEGSSEGSQGAEEGPGGAPQRERDAAQAGPPQGASGEGEKGGEEEMEVQEGGDEVPQGETEGGNKG
ncbi:endoplasmic reticulum junction formation protein lunapark-B-like [Mya arenaria]|uniref:endoplasmic reticulum junction formation protein lunapark-B-like n=1 Tax=Mya arenaria TaxID=6604 RepID=UPI0022E1FF95|nr:endoplasmic reticulum junction formation protein lunapark-B-like [Mya arenaria]